MHWLTFFILAYAAVALQSTALGALTGTPVGGATVNLLLALGVYYAFSARRAEAPWACLACGLFADLASEYPFGVFTATFALAGWAVTRVRAQLFGEHPLSVLVVTAVLTAAVELVAGAAALLRCQGTAHLWGRLVGTSLLTAVLTALAAVPLHWLLRRQRARRLLGTAGLVRQ
jgi:rod shape-determining protein MreD